MKRGLRKNREHFAESKTKRARVLWLLALLLFAVFLGSFALGRYGVSAWDVVRILAYRAAAFVEQGLGALLQRPVHFLPESIPWTAQMETAVINIRLPRILLACLVGCCLSAAGASYQGVMENPMASPDVLGASSGAAFGAALAILLGASKRGITLAAFAASLCAVGLVLIIAQRAPGHRVVNLILAGIMTGSLLTAGTSYVKLVADPTNQLPEITYWLMGSLSGARLKDVGFAALPMALGCIPLLLIRWRINLLTLGEEEAHALGVNTNLLRLVVIVCATLITAASIAVSGMIGWVGLVIPHLARKLVGSNYHYFLPASMLAGAAFLLAVDGVSRCLLAVEIPIGILTAFIGAPFFIYLILRREKTL